ncbi:type I secretion system permease/ATPase [Halioxenophilus aromaticivorans]|uniref:Type I secretion system permease/ATPase n=1 Tax=Halioxenophilus aromaticivorans TaxID=1306992 RepID=A0AAV3U2J6_9ALTE
MNSNVMHASAKSTGTDSGGPLMDCLQIVCGLYSVPVCSTAVLNDLPLKHHKLTPISFEDAASKVGMSSRMVVRKLSEINTELLPAVAILKNNQACVLTGFDARNKKITVIYPELKDCEETVPLAEFKERYTGYIIFVRPTRKAEKLKPLVGDVDAKGWFKNSLKCAVPLYRDVLIASVVISLLSLALPLFVMNVYDRVVPNAAVETLWVLAVGAGIALLSDWLLKMLRYFFVELAASRIELTLSSTVFGAVLGLHLKDRPLSVGAFVNNVQSIESIRSFTNSITLVAFIDIPFALIFAAIIAMIHPYLVFPIAVGCSVIVCYALYTQRTMSELSDESKEISASRNGLLTEVVSHIDDIKFFNTHNHMRYQWERQSLYLAKVNAKLRLLSSSVTSLASWVHQTVGVCLIIVGVYLVIEGYITQGGLIAAYLLSGRLMGPMAMVAGLLAQFFQAVTAYKTLSNLIEQERESPQAKQWSKHAISKGSIEFSNVVFKYPDQTNQALKDINLRIEPGEKVAILGHNGSGKTTINKLLLKSYQPTSGLVTVDGIDINQYEPSALRNSLAYVPQDIALFSGTLHDNLTSFDEEVSEDKLWQLMDQLGFSNFVNNNPNGINMLVGERGGLMSGGQRQTVALIRALIRNPQIYILDEPTSFMDSTTEANFCRLLTAEAKGKTVIVNTHRQALLQLVDRIILLDKGRCIADGDRDAVLAKLAKVQSAGAINGRA